jgi:hypothetical protein
MDYIECHNRGPPDPEPAPRHNPAARRMTPSPRTSSARVMILWSDYAEGAAGKAAAGWLLTSSTLTSRRPTRHNQRRSTDQGPLPRTATRTCSDRRQLLFPGHSTWAASRHDRHLVETGG